MIRARILLTFNVVCCWLLILFFSDIAVSQPSLHTHNFTSDTVIDEYKNHSRTLYMASSAVKDALNDIKNGNIPDTKETDYVLLSRYSLLITIAVLPNWHKPANLHGDYSVLVRIRLTMDGKVADCRLEKSSGNADFDASAINAVWQTGTFPPPPTPSMQEFVVNFCS